MLGQDFDRVPDLSGKKTMVLLNPFYFPASSPSLLSSISERKVGIDPGTLQLLMSAKKFILHKTLSPIGTILLVRKDYIQDLSGLEQVPAWALLMNYDEVYLFFFLSCKTLGIKRRLKIGIKMMRTKEVERIVIKKKEVNDFFFDFKSV